MICYFLLDCIGSLFVFCDYFRGFLFMIEMNNVAREDEVAIREFKVIFRCSWEFFEVMYEIVAEIADGALVEEGL